MIPSDQLTERNVESWQDVVAFYEELTSKPFWERIAPLLRLTRQIVQSDRAKRFRGGTSLWLLMISTAAKHGLQPSDPFVCVSLDDDYRLFKFEYWNGENTTDCYFCDEADVLATRDRFLERLWNDTRGHAGHSVSMG